MVEIRVNSWSELEELLRAGIVEPVRIVVDGVCIGDLHPKQNECNIDRAISVREAVPANYGALTAPVSVSNTSNFPPKSSLEAAVDLLILENQQHQITTQAAYSSEEKFSHFFNYSPTPTRIEDWSEAKAFLNAQLSRHFSVPIKQLSTQACDTFLEANPVVVNDCLSRVEVVDFNPSFLALIDASHEPDYASQIGSLLSPSTRSDMIKLLSDILVSEDVISGQLRIRRLDGGERHVQLQYLPLQNDSDEHSRVIVTYLDITENKRLKELIITHDSNNESDGRVTYAFNSIREGVITTDNQGNIKTLNDTARRLLSWDDGYQGKIIHEVFSPFNTSFDNIQLLYDACSISKAAVECDSHSLVETKSGLELWVTYSVTPIVSGNLISEFVVMFHDVSESQSLLERLRLQTCKDALTNLYNRQEFEKQIKISLDSAKRKGHTHAFLLVDLDQFKVINESCGHHAGDELLRQISKLLETKVRAYDIVARMGGDEFAIMLKNCGDEGAMSIANSILDSIRAFRFVWDGKIFTLTSSIGIVLLADNIKHVQTALSYADFAVHAAKDAGKNRIQLYDKNQKNLAYQHEQLEWVTKINYALEHDLMVLCSQEICPISYAAGKDVHFELLIRMLATDGSLISPGEFLPAAERYNLMPKVDRWVIKRAFTWLAANAGKRIKLGLCSINLSGHSISDETFFQYVEEQFQTTGIPGNLICFEITESMAIYNLSQTLQFIHKFKAYGCKFALDDFGSGFSSYGYLKSLPVDFLKIDGGFVRQMVSDPIDYAMVKSINEVGHVMNTMTIAEFVENEETLSKLKEIGVDFVQGFGIGKPELLSFHQDATHRTA